MKKSHLPQEIVLEHARGLTEIDLNPDSRPVHIPAPTNATLCKIHWPTADQSAIEVWREANKPPAPPPPPPPRPTAQSCPSILSADKFPAARTDAAEIVADAGELRDLVKPLWLHFHPAQILDELGFAPDDLVEVVLPGHGPTVRTYAAIRNDLQSFSKINPSPLVLGFAGDEPTRRFLVTRFLPGINLPAQGRRVAFLRRFGDLSLLVLDSQCLMLEAWWNVQALPAKKVERLYTKAAEIGADPKCGLRNFRAVMPGAPVMSGQSVFATMRDLGLVKDAGALDRIGMRNFVLHFARNKP